MLYDNIEKLIAGIAIVTVLLICCIAVDSADETIVVDNNDSLQQIPEGVTVINDSYVLKKNSGMAVSDGKVYEEKPTITMWAKPSVRSKYAYRWYKKSFVDYCPNCHHYNVLLAQRPSTTCIAAR